MNAEARRFLWSVRREVWENRSIYLAPLAVAGLIVVGSLIRLIHLPAKLAGSAVDPAAQHRLVEEPYMFAAGLLMFTTMVVGIVYCLDAFQAERRDRSILFWKSMPVSDRTTVLSKAAIPLLLLPVITFAVTLGTHWVMLLFGSLRLLASGQSPAVLWSHLSLLEMSALLLYHLVAVHGLLWAPFWGWLLLVSAWARRIPVLWAILPLLAVAMVEHIAFGTTHFGHMLGRRFMGTAGSASGGSGGMTMMSMAGPPGGYLLMPAFWLGLVVCAAFLVAAARLRRSRGPF